jgi:hypothetical protein
VLKSACANTRSIPRTTSSPPSPSLLRTYSIEFMLVVVTGVLLASRSGDFMP